MPFESQGGEFASAVIDRRQELYRELCEQVWNVTAFGLKVHASVPGTSDKAVGSTKSYRITIGDLMESGLLTAGIQLIGEHTGNRHAAVVTAEGKVKLLNGDVFDTPSGAAMATLNRRSWNGWAWWRAETAQGSVKLSRLREEHIERTRQ